MATPDNSIFRQRALEKYKQRREKQVILRLVSPPMFVFLWALLLLFVCAGALIWNFQEPVMIQGKGLVVQPKATDAKNQPGIVVLLLLPSDQLANIKVGQPVTISITSANISFTSTITSVETGVMSPASITSQLNLQQSLQQSLAQTISGPATVAMASVEPASRAQTYLGSQCQTQVQVGTKSVASQLPGFDNLPRFSGSLPQFFNSTFLNVKDFFKNLLRG